MKFFPKVLISLVLASAVLSAHGMEQKISSKQQEVAPTNIEQLPDEILTHIFSYLADDPKIKAIIAIAKVSKRFNRLCKDEPLNTRWAKTIDPREYGGWELAALSLPYGIISYYKKISQQSDGSSYLIFAIKDFDLTNFKKLLKHFEPQLLAQWPNYRNYALDRIGRQRQWLQHDAFLRTQRHEDYLAKLEILETMEIILKQEKQ